MMNDKMSVDLTRQELGVIEAALRTQEKILSVQSRADEESPARARLDELKQVLRTLERQSVLPPQGQSQGWGIMTRGFFG